MQSNYLNWIQKVLDLTDEVSLEISKILQRPSFDIQIKLDNSPVTEADLLSNRIIEQGLLSIDPSIPVISEEASPPPLSIRKKWQRYWLIDPLDGTKEFIHRNPEFTINVALMEKIGGGGDVEGVSGDFPEAHFIPIIGIVVAPLLGQYYWAIRGYGAFFQSIQSTIQPIQSMQSTQPIHPIPSSSIQANHQTPKNSAIHRSEPLQLHSRQALTPPIQIAISHYHWHKNNHQKSEPAWNALISRLPGAHEVIKLGSSLKICKIATGEIDFYPRFGPTGEWDTAAGQCILEEAGGRIVDLEGNSLQYNNKENLINPNFYAVGTEALLNYIVDK